MENLSIPILTGPQQNWSRSIKIYEEYLNKR